MATQRLDNSQRLAEGAEKALETLGFRIDVPSPIEHFEQPREYTTPHHRRWQLPVVLLVTAIISMTWAGLTVWSPVDVLATALNEQSLFEVRRSILANWFPGLIFSLSLTAILGAHELGHYFATRLYRIQSTLPLFIPFPISPIGTCGAVILMDGRQADRKQIFDIGIAGPLAGMVLAIPIAILGLVYKMPLESRGETAYLFGQPLLIQWLDWMVSAEPMINSHGITNAAMNPMLMAAWVGMLVTGLNMMPISQLDGGHVIFGLLGKRSAPVSWTIYIACVIYVAVGAILFGQALFVVMLLLIPLMGIVHPPSRNDDVELGLGRRILGSFALTLPMLCIPLQPIVVL